MSEVPLYGHATHDGTFLGHAVDPGYPDVRAKNALSRASVGACFLESAHLGPCGGPGMFLGSYMQGIGAGPLGAHRE